MDIQEHQYDQALRKKYIGYLFSLYEIEKEGFDVGDYPTYQEFLEIYNEELKAYKKSLN